MGFFSRKEKRPAAAPPLLVKLEQEKTLLLDSVGGMERAGDVQALVFCYQDAVSRLGIFNKMAGELDDTSSMDILEDIDGLFVDRLPALVDSHLKSNIGPDCLLNMLERCERVEGGVVDDAIMEEQDKVFRRLHEGVNWSKGGAAPLALDQGHLEDLFAKTARRHMAQKKDRRSGQEGG